MSITDKRFVNVQSELKCWSALHQVAEATGAESALCMCVVGTNTCVLTCLCVSVAVCILCVCSVICVSGGMRRARLRAYGGVHECFRCVGFALACVYVIACDVRVVEGLFVRCSFDRSICVC